MRGLPVASFLPDCHPDPQDIDHWVPHLHEAEDVKQLPVQNKAGNQWYYPVWRDIQLQEISHSKQLLIQGAYGLQHDPNQHQDLHLPPHLQEEAEEVGHCQCQHQLELYSI